MRKLYDFHHQSALGHNIYIIFVLMGLLVTYLLKSQLPIYDCWIEILYNQVLRYLLELYQDNLRLLNHVVVVLSLL